MPITSYIHVICKSMSDVSIIFSAVPSYNRIKKNEGLLLFSASLAFSDPARPNLRNSPSSWQILLLWANPKLRPSPGETIKIFSINPFELWNTKRLIELKSVQEPDFPFIKLIVLSESPSIATGHSFGNLLMPGNRTCIGQSQTLNKCCLENKNQQAKTMIARAWRDR